MLDGSGSLADMVALLIEAKEYQETAKSFMPSASRKIMFLSPKDYWDLCSKLKYDDFIKNMDNKLDFYLVEGYTTRGAESILDELKGEIK